MASTGYLTKDDYGYQIRTLRLDQILDDETLDEDTMLDNAEVDALSMISLYLSNYYNMDVEFAKSGDQRNKIVVRWAKVLVLYFIYERVPDDLVPERIVKNYDDVKEMLEAINGADKNVPGLSPLTTTDADGNQVPETRRRFGSSARRSNDGSSQPFIRKY
jgi:hypothetical protein